MDLGIEGAALNVRLREGPGGGFYGVGRLRGRFDGRNGGRGPGELVLQLPDEGGLASGVEAGEFGPDYLFFEVHG